MKKNAYLEMAKSQLLNTDNGKIDTEALLQGICNGGLMFKCGVQLLEVGQTQKLYYTVTFSSKT